jgi:YgiT-type zinc finger domain-containing protein
MKWHKVWKLMIKITICPTCGSGEIKKVCRNWIGKVQGKTYTVPKLEFYECPSCGEKIYDRSAMQKINAYSPAFSKKVREKGRTATRKAA